MESFWIKTKAIIKTKIPPHSYKMWIEPVEYKERNNEIITLTCPNTFSIKRVQDNYGKLLESEIKQILGISCKIIFELCEKKPDSRNPTDVVPQLPVFKYSETRPPSGRFLRPDFTFDQFVVGGNNDYAYSASLALATKKTSQQHSLFLLSKTGMGKSHLIQAVGNHILSENPLEQVYYITAEDFSNEMVSAYQQDSIDQFKKKYRTGCNVLLIDDVHYLSGKEKTQVELSMALDALCDSGKKIIFSSSYLPVDIPRLNDKLCSRLSAGLISTIDPPNYRTRIRILNKKAALKGIQIPEDIANYLAAELTENVRQLESGLIGISAKSSLLGSTINMALAESIVKNIVHRQKMITIDAIKKLVCKEFNVTLNSIVSSSRKQVCVRARQIAMYLSRRFTDSPLQAIGKSFNRYHATALHSINSIEKELKENIHLQKQIEHICHQLEEGNF